MFVLIGYSFVVPAKLHIYRSRRLQVLHHIGGGWNGCRAPIDRLVRQIFAGYPQGPSSIHMRYANIRSIARVLALSKTVVSGKAGGG